MSATKCHTSRSPGAVAWPGPTSSSPTIVITSSDSSTCDEPLARRRREDLLRVLQHAGAAHDPAAGHVDAARRSGRSCCRTPPGRGRGWCPSRADRRTSRRADTTASAGRACRRSAASCGGRGRSGRRAASCASRSRAFALDFAAIGVGERDARDRLIEARRARAGAAPAPPPRAAAAAARRPAPRRGRRPRRSPRCCVTTMPSVFSAGTDAPRGTRPRKMLWSSRSTISVSSCGLLLCSAIVSRAGDRLRRRIEPRVDRVVGLQLPVVGSGPAGRVARAGVVGAPDRIGQRHVAPDGARD